MTTPSSRQRWRGPRLASKFSAWRFNYGDDPIGTVIADDGIKVTIKVPEHVIPARADGHSRLTFEAEWDDEHERWIDWTDKEENDRFGDVGGR